MAGDRPSLDDTLRAAPVDPIANAGLDRYRKTFDLHAANAEKSRGKLAEDLAKAEGEMKEAIAKDELSKALRSAANWKNGRLALSARAFSGSSNLSNCCRSCLAASVRLLSTSARVRFEGRGAGRRGEGMFDARSVAASARGKSRC